MTMTFTHAFYNNYTTCRIIHHCVLCCYDCKVPGMWVRAACMRFRETSLEWGRAAFSLQLSDGQKHNSRIWRLMYEKHVFTKNQVKRILTVTLSKQEYVFKYWGFMKPKLFAHGRSFRAILACCGFMHQCSFSTLHESVSCLKNV